VKSAPTQQSNVEVMESGMLRYPPAVKLFHFLKMKWHLTVFYILVHYCEVDSALFHRKMIQA